jgi:hypothetical protein
MTATQTDRLPSGTAIVVAGCIILALAAGLRQMLGVFLQRVTLDLDIGRQSFGLAIGIQNLVWGLHSLWLGICASSRSQAGGGRVRVALHPGAGRDLGGDWKPRPHDVPWRNRRPRTGRHFLRGDPVRGRKSRAGEPQERGAGPDVGSGPRDVRPRPRLAGPHFGAGVAHGLPCPRRGLVSERRRRLRTPVSRRGRRRGSRSGPERSRVRSFAHGRHETRHWQPEFGGCCPSASQYAAFNSRSSRPFSPRP